MSKKIFCAEVDSPYPSAEWYGLSDATRIEKINKIMNHANMDLDKKRLIVAGKKDGQVVVRILNPLTASVRGSLLLDFEEFIKKNIDHGLTVWGEALGDKNSLRNLRGIEVKVS